MPAYASLVPNAVSVVQSGHAIGVELAASEPLGPLAGLTDWTCCLLRPISHSPTDHMALTVLAKRRAVHRRAHLPRLAGWTDERIHSER